MYTLHRNFLVAALVACGLASQASALVVDKRSLFPAGSTLTVGFAENCGNDLRTQVRQIAPEWSKYANIKFNFVESLTGDITVGCNPGGGHYSLVGTVSRSRKPSMNIGFEDRDNRQRVDKGLSRVILHEFG